LPITGFGASPVQAGLAASVAVVPGCAYVKEATEQLIAERVVAEAGRPFIYAFGPSTGGGPSKDDQARRIAERDGITEGLVCVLRAVEPCTTFELRGHRNGEVHTVPTSGRCLHVYFYLIRPGVRFMHVRVHTRIPYTVQVYVNGREWLARQLDTAGVGYLRHDQRASASTPDRLDALAALVSAAAVEAFGGVLRERKDFFGDLVVTGRNAK
jgi:hypothetical protein